MTKPGARVGAIRSATTSVVDFYGYGVYDGDFDHEVMEGVTVPNPRITLDGGGVVWGCECWWGGEDAVKKRIGGRKVVIVPVPERKP
jgi:hypothetical protein